MANTLIEGNRALDASAVEVLRLVEEEKRFTPAPEISLLFPNLTEVLRNITLLELLSDITFGHGGGVCVNVIGLRIFAVAEILFQNVLFVYNEAVVGGTLPLLSVEEFS